MGKPATANTINDLRTPTDTPLVLAFDPGPSTGWAVASLTCTGQLGSWFATGQQSGLAVLDDTGRLLERVGLFARSQSTIVIEKFTLLGGPGGVGKHAAFTCEVIGVLKHMTQLYGTEDPVLRMPSDRLIVNKDVLKSMSMYPKGAVDALSATQHLVSYLIQGGAVPKSCLVV